MTNNQMTNNKVIIITGSKGEGKTTKLLNIINLLKKENIKIAGFTATGEWNNGERNKYTLNDINSEKSVILCTGFPVEDYQQHGRFYFNPKAIKFGNKLLKTNAKENLLIIIDEVGPFELDDQVWHNSLSQQLKTTQNTILLSVREKLVNNIIEKYNLKNASIYTIKEPDLNIVREIKLII